MWLGYNAMYFIYILILVVLMGLLLYSSLKLQIPLTEFYKMHSQSMIIKPSMLAACRKVRSCVHRACDYVKPHSYVCILEIRWSLWTCRSLYGLTSIHTLDLLLCKTGFILLIEWETESIKHLTCNNTQLEYCYGTMLIMNRNLENWMEVY